MIKREDIEKIINAARIEEVVGSFVELRKRGVNYIGLCPFHNEKTPSFNVNPAKGIFKCFGCGEGGDSVAFLMKHEHYTYPEALRWLANKYGIQIEEQVLTKEEVAQQSERDRIYQINDFAQKYFQEVLGIKKYQLQTNFFVVETTGEHRSDVFRLNNSYINVGMKEFKELICRLAWHQVYGFDKEFPESVQV